MLIIAASEIEKIVTPVDLVNAIEHAYRIAGAPETYIPERLHLDNGENTLLLMPGFAKNVFGTKLVSLFPQNARDGKPVLNGLMVLNNGFTGVPLAILEGSKLTAMRTGAVGAAAVQHLAPAGATTLGIIGAGVQAFHQVLLIAAIRPFQKLLVCDHDISKAQKLQESLHKRLSIPLIEVTANANELVDASDVVVTATSSHEPVFRLPAEKLSGKTFIGIGSYKPGMQEMPAEVTQAAGRIYVDTLHAKNESGDVRNPLGEGLVAGEQVIPFADLLADKNKPAAGKARFFKSVGMALFDLVCAELIYRKATEKGLGTEVEF